MSRRWFGSLAFVLLAGIPTSSAQAPSPPVPSGRTIEAADGDLIIIPSASRVTIIRRTQAHARLVYFEAQRTVLLITDSPLEPPMGPPGSKNVRRFQTLDPWPIEAKWEGSTTIDEYLPPGRTPGFAIHTDRGVVFLGFWRPDDAPLIEKFAGAVRIGASSHRPAWGSFDEIELAWLAGGDNALRGPDGRMQMQVSGGFGAVVSQSTTGPIAPVRVGGNVRPPRRTHYAEPVYPQDARAARVQGVVILEVIIGDDGAVSNAHVLRSIPLLDAAALDAVRQWRFTPTLVNGVPTPVIMTVTVNFSLAPSSP